MLSELQITREQLLVLRTEFDILSKEVQVRGVTSDDIRDRQVRLEEKMSQIEDRQKHLEEGGILGVLTALLKIMFTAKNVWYILVSALCIMLFYFVIWQDGLLILLGKK